MNYTYEATTAGDGLWIVKRFDQNNFCQEAEVFNCADKTAAIEKAIEQNSWA